jgi:hypothetical protein
MIEYATDRQLPIKIVLFDSNRNQENTLFKKEFDEYVNINRNIKTVYTITEEGEQSRDPKIPSPLLPGNNGQEKGEE